MAEVENNRECFVMMPISDMEGYEQGHFKRVYDDIIKPACEKATYSPIRADDISEADIIHVSILKKLIEAPMAICDLSGRNPNVLFELGLRQAFDKPVVLVQEKGTKPIFDISIIRVYEYNKELKYRSVLDDQDAISKYLKGTDKAFSTGEGSSSITKLLAIKSPAVLPNVSDPNEVINIQLSSFQAQLENLFKEIKNLTQPPLLNYSQNYDIDNVMELYNYFLTSYNNNDIKSMEKYYNMTSNIIKNTNNKRMFDLLNEMQHKMFNMGDRNTPRPPQIKKKYKDIND